MLAIGILVFDDVEILDFSGPYEVFSTAARVHAGVSGQTDLFRCFLVAEKMRPVRSRGGMKVLPDCVLLDSYEFDLLLVAGGDVSQVINNPKIIQWIAQQATQTPIVASVCSGALLLAKAGLLDGLEATTHSDDQHELQTSFPQVKVCSAVAWVDCGCIVTSGGISAGIDMSLHLLERCAGTQLAQATARQMEYQWDRRGMNGSFTGHARTGNNSVNNSGNNRGIISGSEDAEQQEYTRLPSAA